ncbi:MAG: hypothetical protein KKB50_17145 [Planctomycetes bacterium]|nr:hypothetical protein [Planctomycetota bacterium]
MSPSEAPDGDDLATFEGGPVYRCSRCLARVPDPGAATRIPCPNCHRHLSVPGHITVRCEQCGKGHQMRNSELKVERLCANCGHPLFVGNVVLSPHRTRHSHSRSRHRDHRHPRLSTHDHAVWIMLLMGLILLSWLVVFSRL